MILYYVAEYILDTWKENACGIYTDKDKAKEAILARVAQEYTPEEMKHFQFDANDEYTTTSNKWVNACNYIIYPMEVNAKLA